MNIFTLLPRGPLKHEGKQTHTRTRTRAHTHTHTHTHVKLVADITKHFSCLFANRHVVEHWERQKAATNFIKVKVNKYNIDRPCSGPTMFTQL